MNVGVLSMPGLGGYGYLQELLQKPQNRSFESFLTPRTQPEPSTGGSQPLASGGDVGSLVRYANPLNNFSVGDIQKATSTRMETGALTLTRQSTEMNIRTRDGDLVTIRLNENEQSAAYLSVDHHEGDVNDNVRKTEVVYQSAQTEASTIDLKAFFKGDEVSDVSIEANSTSQGYINLHIKSQNEDGQTTVDYRSAQATSSHFSFELEGSLDQEELEAIGSLLKDIDALASEFFAGDIQVAFQKATQLGYDDSEIAGYAFNMVEQETNIVADRYSSNTGDAGLPASVNRPIAGYMERLQRIQDTANLYFEMKVLEVMMDRIAGTRERDTQDEKEGVEASERFRAFNERILDAMFGVVD